MDSGKMLPYQSPETESSTTPICGTQAIKTTAMNPVETAIPFHLLRVISLEWVLGRGAFPSPERPRITFGNGKHGG